MSVFSDIVGKQKGQFVLCTFFFVCLFTYDLFSDVVRKPDYLASTDRMMNNIGYRYYLCFEFCIIVNNTEFS
jgi:hypothetical protein